MKLLIYVSLVILFVFGFHSVAGQETNNVATSTPQVATATPLVVAIMPKAASFDSEVVRLAKKYAVSESLSRNIIKCEGLQYKTLGNNKNYRNGVHWSTDIGWWQVNDYYHAKTAKRMGLNLYNDWDNLEYGFWLLSKQGSQPWSASRHCWSKVV